MWRGPHHVEALAQGTGSACGLHAAWPWGTASRAGKRGLTFGGVGFRNHAQPVGRDGCQRQVIEAHPGIDVESLLIISFHIIQLGHDQIGFL